MGVIKWTDEMHDFLRENFATLSRCAIAEVLGVSEGAVKARATKLGLFKRNSDNYRVLSASEKEMVQREYPKGDLEALASKLGVKLTVLYQKALALGLRRDPEMVIERNRALGKALSASDNGHRFKPGQAAYNKGKKQAEFMTPEAIERTAATRFKKGDTTHNRQPVGYERVGKDGYIEVKVRDMAGNENFEFKHRVVWQDHNGPVPEGMIIEFVDGNILNFDIANLRCVSRVENLKRNTTSDGAIAKRFFEAKTDADVEFIKNNLPEVLELKRAQMKVNGAISRAKRAARKPKK